MEQITPEGKAEAFRMHYALRMHYAVISKMTGVYSNFFENEACAVVTMRGPGILKNPTWGVNQEETGLEISENGGNIPK